MSGYVGSAASKNAKDKGYLCSVFCSCNQSPLTGTQGQNLKQACATQALRQADRSCGWHAHYKAEVPYDMKGKYTQGKGPLGVPYPIMSAKNPTKPSEYWQRHVQKSGGWENYEKYDVRIPDVVAVHDAYLPPTRENIRKIYEMKFPGDRWGDTQFSDYIKIVGSNRKKDVRELNINTCGCKPKAESAPKKQESWFMGKLPVFTRSDTSTDDLYDRLHGREPARKHTWDAGFLPIPIRLPGGIRVPFR